MGCTRVRSFFSIFYFVCFVSHTLIHSYIRFFLRLLCTKVLPRLRFFSFLESVDSRLLIANWMFLMIDGGWLDCAWTYVTWFGFV